MTYSTLQIAPGPGFWQQTARLLIGTAREQGVPGDLPDLSGMRVVLPTFVHVKFLREALAIELGASFIPPQSCTLPAWLQQQMPIAGLPAAASETERLMELYAGLRELGWLKKLFAARRNTDLLPLAKTLLALSDELTTALLPAALALPSTMEDRWREALAQLSLRAAALLTEEAQLVWGIWHSQRDARDPGVLRHAQMMQLAATGSQPLIWIAPAAPDPFEEDFLQAYAARQSVRVIRLDWSAAVLPPLLPQCWPELAEEASTTADFSPSQLAPPTGLALFEATSLEDEAQCAAQTIINWLLEGKTQIAIVPQDRVVARRMRALLERAQVVVSDETGWKLSTTRAAAVLAAWLELVASDAQTTALLDFLKSPFLFDDPVLEEQQRMAIERALVEAKVAGGWSAVAAALSEQPAAKSLIDAIAREAARFAVRKTIAEWGAATRGVFDALGMLESLTGDVAGQQVLEMLDLLVTECASLSENFSLSEWRALVELQLEQTVFMAARLDQRVMMVPLNGTPMRQFDAVIIVGGDASHLPSQPVETLFFANAVRRELGLATRESRQQQQLRDFAALLLNCPTVVFSWQAQRDGEHNPVSVWIQRMQLSLDRLAAGALAQHTVSLPLHVMQADLVTQPQPAAPALVPQRLSASGYNALVACPYQFFATRMLGLSSLGELDDLPQKRDYGEWLHHILLRYHTALSEQRTPPAQRADLLTAISEEVFAGILEKNPAALGYRARWNKIMPAYLEWADQHEKEGWQFAFGERGMNKVLAWEGGSVTLHGRVDRVDQNAAGDSLVLDYKTTKQATLKKKLAAHEDHQLPFYGLLVESATSGARYVAIDDAKGGTLAAEPFAMWRDALASQIKSGMQAIAQGAVLPATGIARTCEWCEVRGLCRKGVW